ncbi:MAG: preprotein translocase subunit SecY [Campylobacter sp.]
MMGTLRNKILITLGFLLVYRVLAYVPVPGVNASVIADFFKSNSDNVFGMLNMFSGQAVERFSVISLGIMPYITASIIMELLAATFPNIGKLKKERDGMQKYMQIIRYATIVITIAQAIGVSIGLSGLSGQSAQSPITIDRDMFVALACVSMLAGTMLLMWIGEQITQRGIGNGISLIIFAGIVSSIPKNIGNAITSINTGGTNLVVAIFTVLIILATIGFVIYVELGERRIPVSYPRKILVQNQNKRIMNYIPIRVNLSGVIPPIFASAVLMFPITILQSSTNEYIKVIADFLNPNRYAFNILMFLLVVFFAYFYASIAFNSKDISENIKKNSGFIPGVRPGEATTKFMNDIASNLTFWGALYLGAISTLPWILMKFMSVTFVFGGTSVLIVVSVALDTMRKIEAQRDMNKYKTLGTTIGL